MNQLYDLGRDSFLTQVSLNGGAVTIQTDWVNDGLAGNIHAVLVNGADYTFDPTHTDMSAIPVAGRLADTPLTNTASDGTGIASADDVVFPSVAAPSSGQGTYVVLYRDNGTATDAEHLLIACIDTATNLPVSPNGGDITVIWNGGTGQQIFKL